MPIAESVVVIGFRQSSHAYQALSELQGLSESLTSLQVRSVVKEKLHPRLIPRHHGRYDIQAHHPLDRRRTGDGQRRRGSQLPESRREEPR